ncbi:hypothetical protein KFU94_62570 [Chloroflexi bacterium TSY]|nr:hypothetical protein [Chloroflexi bacterium TSY]
MFQSYLEGERWDDIEGELSNDEHDRLWYQFARFIRSIPRQVINLMVLFGPTL